MRRADRFVVFGVVALLLVSGLLVVGTLVLTETNPFTRERPATVRETAELENGRGALSIATQAATPTTDDGDDEGEAEVSDSCMTTGEAQDVIGVNVQRLGTEACAWVWRAVSLASTTAECPKDFVCTFDTGDGVKVYVGPFMGSIVAGTWRQVEAYPAGDAVFEPCTLLAKEQAFGFAEVPSFLVVAGNFSCAQAIAPASATPAASAPTPASAAPAAQACPSFGGRQTKLLNEEQGTAGGCKLKYEGSVYTDEVPANWWTYYWDGSTTQKASSDERITTGDATFYPNPEPEG